MTLKGKGALLGAALVLMVPLVQAAPPAMTGMYGPPAAASRAPDPSQVLKQGVERLAAFLSQGGTGNQAQLQAFLDQEISPYFDFAYMARWVGGPRYRYMNPAQRADLERALKGMFLGAMAEKLAGYRYGGVRYLPVRQNPRTGEVDLSIQALQPGGLTTQLDFRLYKSAEGWKVFDVTANGQSALVYYRRYFARTGGPGYRRMY
jgi:phospholipid transport system substrate-binding protein